MKMKRILSASMASVLALSSFAVVASAEEAAVTNVKSKADLEAMVKSLESFRENDVYEYGTLSAERFVSLMEFADSVLASDEATVDDYTVVYHMILAVKEQLKIYSASELNTLINKCESAYNSNNIYNEDLGDNIYNTEKYSVFSEAFEDAEAVVDSGDSHLITDSYEVLEKAYNDLEKLDVITKSQFTAILKEYETATMDKYAYDSWTIGEFAETGSIPTDTYENYAGKKITWGGLYSLLTSYEEDIYSAYHSITSIKEANRTSNEEIVEGYYRAADAVKLFKLWSTDVSNNASKRGVSALLNEYHNVLAYDYNKAGGDALFAEVQRIAGTFDEGKTIQVRKYNESGYSTNLYDVADVADGWLVDYEENEMTDLSDSTLEGKVKVYKNTDASISVKSDITFYIPVDKNGMWTGEELVTTRPSGASASSYKPVNRGTETDLVKYLALPVAMDEFVVDNSNVVAVTTSAADLFVVKPNIATNNANKNDVLDGGNGIEYVYKDGGTVSVMDENLYNTVDLGIAYNTAQLYINGTKEEIKADTNGIYFMDSTGAVASGSASGSTREWSILYKYLKRALEDKYSISASSGTYTKADVDRLIDYAYDLSDKTGDIALFHENHMALVNARQAANAWMSSANSNKTYKDNQTVINGMVSTQAYNELKKYCDALEQDMAAFKYSYGDIYDYVAEVYEKLDKGEIAQTEQTLEAINKVLGGLATLESMDAEYGLDNDVFSIYNEFMRYNRLFTYGKEYKFGSVELAGPEDSSAVKAHTELTKDFETLKAYAESVVVETKTGDANGDGVVNTLDASAILQSVVGMIPALGTEADYNKDGIVTALDASAILRAIVDGTV